MNPNMSGTAKRLPPLLHVYQPYPAKNTDTVRRETLARFSWDMSYKRGDWRPCPIYPDTLPRVCDDGNGRRLPFVRDILDAAVRVCDGRMIFFTNTDTVFSTDLSYVIQGVASRSVSLGLFRRRDFHHLNRLLEPRQISHGDTYPGDDAFLFPKSWWEKHRLEYPDMVFGAASWDCIMAQMFLRDGGIRVENCIYHERHRSVWDLPANKYTLPSQILNHRLAAELFNKMLKAGYPSNSDLETTLREYGLFKTRG